MTPNPSSADIQPPLQLTLQDALDLGVRLLQTDQIDNARDVYRTILKAIPDHVDALQFLGIGEHQAGRSEEGLALIRRALELRPDAPNIHNNLGKVLSDLGRTEEALAACTAALALKDDLPDALSNLGSLLEAKGRLQEAEALYRRAYASDPTYAPNQERLVVLLHRTGRAQEGVGIEIRVLEDAPRSPEQLELLTHAYERAGQTDRALATLAEFLAEDPDNLQARHLWSALSGEGVPDRASDALVKDMFGDLSETFDEKLAILDYRGPELVGAAIASALGRPARALEILDAGCGTGLCGPHLAPFARRLVGIDLSEKMLARASGRPEYDDLACAELVGYLAEHPVAFDVVVSADTLCYFGALAAVLSAAFGAMRPGGLLVFTVEECGRDLAESFRLAGSGRYVHRRDYVESALREARFEDVAMEPVELRKEYSTPVMGLVVVGRKPLRPATTAPAGDAQNAR